MTCLRAYFENQVILEPILLYRTSKYKQTKEAEQLILFVDPYFYFFM